MTSHRISIDIPEEEHKYLKMCCARLGISIKDFVLKSVMSSVENQEDQWWLEKPETQELLRQSAEGTLETISFEQAMKELLNGEPDPNTKNKV